MNRIAQALRSFFALLFSGSLPADIAEAHGFVRKPARPQTGPQRTPADGALQMLSILQRDARLVDFFMEDISAYSDEQVGAAVRSLHEQCRQSLRRYVGLAPVIDGVEGTYTKIEGQDPATVKLLGNVPAHGKVAGGTLRHKGWRAERLELPGPAAGENARVIAPAEIEIE